MLVRIITGPLPLTCRSDRPTKNELVINLKAAKAIGLDVPANCSPAPTR